MSEGRRPVDGALLRWVPFMSLVAMLILQTIYFTRYISAMEMKQVAGMEQMADLKAQVTALTTSYNSNVIPQAQTNWRLQQVESGVAECRARWLEVDRAGRISR